MTSTNPIEVHLEAQGAKPNFRYDIIQPLVQGRVPIEGVSLTVAGAMETAGQFDNPKFKNGDFGLLDTNVGDILPAIDAGWDMVALPVLIKRKPIYNYIWVRADRRIETPKDLEGKTFATAIWGVVTTYARGMLKKFHDVDHTTFKWIANVDGPWPLHKPVNVEYRTDKKPQWQRLLDGEVDACSGDIIDPKAWEILESSPDIVKRLFPNYRQMHRDLRRDHGIVTPTHMMCMGGKLHRENPGLSRRLYDAFEQSREIAIADAKGDGSSYNLIMDARELMRDQLKEMGDIYKHGVAANRDLFEMTFDFYEDQGQTSRRLSLEEVFTADTLDT
jgi:4,5-dihydroxyphthalate decarboxylase